MKAGKAYCTKGGRWWILRRGSAWNLVSLDRHSAGQPSTVGRFTTLTAAVAFYRTEVTA